MDADTATRFRLGEDSYLERVRREVRLGTHFSALEFERAFAAFQQMFQVRPQRVYCSPDVLSRYCRLYERGGDAAMHREIRFNGVALCASILPPGIIAFEGEVDEGRMGDW